MLKGKERYFKCNNLAETPDEQFILDPDDYIKAEKQGEITAVIHSHPNTNHYPSYADKAACRKNRKAMVYC